MFKRKLHTFITGIVYCHKTRTEFGRTRGHLDFCRVKLRFLASMASSSSKDCKKQPPKVQTGKKSGGGQPGTLRYLNYIQRHGGESNLPPPGIIDLHVMGTGAAGTPRGIFIDMTHFRYMFNCGECSQRVAMEHKMRISKVKNIFITHKNWDNLGGLLGMALSLEGIGLPEITLHGPPKVEEMLTMSRGFSPLKNIKIHKKEISEERFQDSAMQIDYIPLYPSPGFDEKHNSASNGSGPASKRRRIHYEDDMSVVYLCKPYPKPRSLDLEKAVDLGVPRGPYLGKLKAGETITLEDGKLVTPDEVLSDPEPNHPFLVLEVPSLAYLDPLLSNERLKEIQEQRDGDAPQLIVHYTPSEILTLPEYQKWMNGFSPETQHLVLNSAGSRVCQIAPYEVQAWLNQVHSGIFPLLADQTDQVRKISEEESSKIVYGETCLRYALRGGNSTEKGFYKNQCLTLETEQLLANPDVLTIRDPQEVYRKIEEVTVKLKEANKPDETNGAYPEMLFLGTGSSIPNKIRNVSAILVHTSEDSCILLDCGEGTYSQLCHFYGDQVDRVLRNLRAVYISHLHADHHMGLIGVVQARERALAAAGQTSEPLHLIVTWFFNKFIEATHERLIPISDKINLVPVEYFIKPEEIEKRKSTCEQLLQELNFSKIAFVRMLHPQHPYGIAITHCDGWKLAYSGDTMPCDNFIDIGRECDILIHEATMEDDLIQDAKDKKHSTTSQAIDIGMRMEAKFILLTHFSQRYAKLPRFNAKFTDKVGIAFDNMKVCRRDLPLLPLLMPALQALFQEELDDMEKRTQKHLRNKKSKTAIKIIEKSQSTQSQ